MRRYLLLRLVWAGPIVLSILTINFLVIHLVPGDPVQALVGDFPTPPGYVEAVLANESVSTPASMRE